MQLRRLLPTPTGAPASCPGLPSGWSPHLPLPSQLGGMCTSSTRILQYVSPCLAAPAPSSDTMDNLGAHGGGPDGPPLPGVGNACQGLCRDTKASLVGAPLRSRALRTGFSDHGLTGNEQTTEAPTVAMLCSGFRSYHVFSPRSSGLHTRTTHMCTHYTHTLPWGTNSLALSVLRSKSQLQPLWTQTLTRPDPAHASQLKLRPQHRAAPARLGVPLTPGRPPSAVFRCL